MKLVRKDVYKLAMPILAEQLFVATLGMVNTMMAGHISKEAVSAIGMIDSFNYILIAFFFSPCSRWYCSCSTVYRKKRHKDG